MSAPRSSEEWQMRDLIVPRLRERWPHARIIHELPLRYSTNRIDLAAVTPDEIIAVEIKSSKDVTDRLEKQIRAFLPVSARVIVALAPVWNEQLGCETTTLQTKRGRVTRISQRYTECQDILRKFSDDDSVETWTVDVENQRIEITDGDWRKDSRPWGVRMLDMLHVAELVQIASRHRCCKTMRPVHLDVRNACADMMTGREITSAVCRALRERQAFARESDPPISAVAA